MRSHNLSTRQMLAATVGVVLLVVLSPVATLAVNQSVHSTQTDFQNAQSTTGLQLKGSGSDAYLEQSVEGSQHTDFGTDNESAPATLQNLTITGSGDSASVVIGDPLNDYSTARTGTVGAIGDDAAGGEDYYAERIVGDGHELESVGVWLEEDTAEGQVRLMFVNETAGGNPNVANPVWTSSLINPDPSGQWYNFTPTGVVPADGENYYITIDGYQNGGSGASNTGTASSGDNLVYSLDGGSSWSTGSAPLAVNFTTNGEIPTAQYVSSTHTVTDAQESWVNITAVQNVSVDLIAEYHDGTAWQTGTSTTVTATGNHTFSLPSVSSETWRIRADVTKTGSDTQFTFADESILSSDQGKYLSQEHQIENATLGFIAVELDKSTAQVTVEGYDSDAGTWENASTKAYSETAFTTYNLSGAYSKYRTTVELSNNDTSGVAQLHAEGVSAGGTTVIQQTTTTSATDTVSLISALQESPENASLVSQLWAAKKAGLSARIDRLIYLVKLRLGLVDTDVTAAEAATSFENYYNDNQQGFTGYVNQRVAGKEVNLTQFDTIKLQFKVDNETATRYVVGLADGDKYATTTVVRETNRTVDQSVNLTDYAAINAKNELKAFNEEYVTEGKPVNLQTQTRLKERYGPDISSTMLNESETASEGA